MKKSIENIKDERRTGEAHTAISKGEDLVAMHIPAPFDHIMKAAPKHVSARAHIARYT